MGDYRFIEVDGEMAARVAATLWQVLDYMGEGQHPKNYPRKPTSFECMAATYVLYKEMSGRMAKHGLKVGALDLGKADGSVINDPSDKTGGGVRGYFLRIREKLTKEVHQMAMVNGGDVPLSMWEGQRMIGQIHLLDQLEELVMGVKGEQ